MHSVACIAVSCPFGQVRRVQTDVPVPPPTLLHSSPHRLTTYLPGRFQDTSSCRSKFVCLKRLRFTASPQWKCDSCLPCWHATSSRRFVPPISSNAPESQEAQSQSDWQNDPRHRSDQQAASQSAWATSILPPLLTRLPTSPALRIDQSPSNFEKRSLPHTTNHFLSGSSKAPKCLLASEISLVV